MIYISYLDKKYTVPLIRARLSESCGAQWVRMRSFLWFNLAPHIHKYMGELAVHSSRNSAHFSVNTASRAISAAFLKIEN